ncbi:hypothetical protein H0H93_016548 [Arthromyces matolae]|nr:hypothetical protein H0H93_016548 [Arthromyces matolae]
MFLLTVVATATSRSSSLSFGTATADEPFWLELIKHQGSSPHNPDPHYQVFRNVKDFGAKGDGVTDDTAAIKWTNPYNARLAISSGSRCGGGVIPCGSSTQYSVSSPIQTYYYTQLIGDAKNPPILIATANFTGLAVIDADPYEPTGGQWFGNTNNLVPPSSSQGTGIHWQVAQATSLINIVIEMSTAPGTAHQGNYGMWVGNQHPFPALDSPYGMSPSTTQVLLFSTTGTGVSPLAILGEIRLHLGALAWTFQDITINNCNGISSVSILDTTILNTAIAVRSAAASSFQTVGSLILDNLYMSNVTTAVADGNNRVILNGGANVPIKLWGRGNVFSGSNPSGTFEQGALTRFTKPSMLLDDRGKVFGRTHPQYGDYSVSQFVSAKTYGAKGDGTTDDTQALQNLINSVVGSKIVFLDAGIYVVTSTLLLPAGTRIVGEAWSVIEGQGTFFSDKEDPRVVVRVGEKNSVGTIEITDVVFTTVGPAPGAIVVEWNVRDPPRRQGAAGMWDSHIRLGGAVGTNLEPSNCPAGSMNTDGCMAAFLGLHLTPGSSAYLEGTWVWLADHDLDGDGSSQVSLYSGRGILSESQGPVWFIGTARSPAIADDCIQPYWQPTPPAPEPFPINNTFKDPPFSWADTSAWAVSVEASEDIFIFGAAQYLNTITENASRLGMRLQESFSEHTRDLSLPRASSASYLEGDDKVKDIRRQLDSNSDREKLDAMKRLIALISKGRNVSEYFAQVVKNVASHNLEIRKLVYIYLLRYAEHEPDLALLSINTFQKDLTDSNPLIRAMALRVLSGIKVPMIGSLVVLAIKKCAADISPYVRKNAALAIPKCFELDNSHLPSLIEVLTTLLNDRSPLSLGCVAVAFEAVCPTRLDLLHKHYRRLCKIIPDVDEWGQVELANLLLRYARTMLPRPTLKEDGEEIDQDVELLVKSIEPLFQSRNPAVVLAVTRIFFYAGPSSHLYKVVNPLLRLLGTSAEVQRTVLVYINVIARVAPHLFAPFLSRFFVRTDDLQQVKKEKIKLLLSIVTPDNHSIVLRELVDYTDDPDDSIVTDAIRGIGLCARIIPELTQQCLTSLISMIKSGQDVIISNAVIVLKNLIQLHLSTSSNMPSTSHSPVTIIAQLARRIDDIRHPQARACVIWLVGQYAASDEKGRGPEGIADWAPDVLRKTAKTFSHEGSLTKAQIIILAAKLFVLSPNDRVLALLTQYVFNLARYDINYDVRDRARMVSSLLFGVIPASLMNAEHEQRAGVVLRREQVKLVLFDGKSEIGEDGLNHTGGVAAPLFQSLIGSLSIVTGKSMCFDGFLPDWLEHGVESSLRDVDEPAPLPGPTAIFSAPQAQTLGPSPIILTPTRGSSPVGSQSQNGAMKATFKDLDKFYDDGQSTEEEGDEKEEDDDDDDDVDDPMANGEGADSDEAGEEDESEEDETDDEDGDGQVPQDGSRSDDYNVDRTTNITS